MLSRMNANSNKVLILAILAIAFFHTSDSLFAEDAKSKVMKPTPEQAKFFEMKIRPLLVKNCFSCHSDKVQKGDLRLDSRTAMMHGGESGESIVPGKPEESMLIEAINYDSYEMPPEKKLPQKEIDLIARWVKMGAPWPGDDGTFKKKEKITDEDRRWWAYLPVTDPQVPKLESDSRANNDVDRFVIQKLQENDLTLAPRATRRQLVRRLFFDLVGMPPTFAEVESFLKDDSPDAYGNLVEQLLADKRYGEHWGRHWLDLVRYAESDGWNQDAYRPNAWRYRDYVIRSLNQDKPYDQFVKEQLAGDELNPNDADSIVATGFLRHGIYEYNQRDAETQWAEISNEVTDVVGDVFLGTSIGCARCHDHKFDAVLREDYYRIQAFFKPMIWKDSTLPVDEKTKAKYDEDLKTWEAKTEEIRNEITELSKDAVKKAESYSAGIFPDNVEAAYYKPYDERSTYEHQLAYLVKRQVDLDIETSSRLKKYVDKKKAKRWDELHKELKKFPKPSLPVAIRIEDSLGEIPPTKIPGLARAKEIPPGYLSVLDASPAEISIVPTAPKTSSGRRTALANWIVSPSNPLATRVLVNRIWHYHFGRGIVSTTSEFGHLGQKPANPELLDWLATRFVEEGWSIKELHRKILLSAAWQQSGAHPDADDHFAKDPENKFFWRAKVRRLDAEQIRDSMLQATGTLDSKMEGPSQSFSSKRKSIYLKVIRNNPSPLLKVFDTANGLVPTPQRDVTTTPLQALMMINGVDIELLARIWSRDNFDKAMNKEKLVQTAYQEFLGRNPSPEESTAAVGFLKSQTEKIIKEKAKRNSKLSPPQLALADLCHVFLNSNEFLYVE